jgi:AAA+ ATPase superfamily predicted ATPase
MDEKSAFLNLIKPHLDAYYGAGYETLCREALSRLYQREELGCAYEIGEYWDKDIQIDIVGYRQDGVTDICECKWGKISSMPRLLKTLNTKITGYPNKDNKTIHGRLFLRSRKKLPSSHSVRTHFLADLYQFD